MNTLEYLEATKIEDVGSLLTQSGYQVIVSPLEVKTLFEIEPDGYALIATKYDKKLAMEVTLPSENGKPVAELMQRRDQAYQEGVDEFILGLANFPSETNAQIEGLEEEIFNHLIHDMPEQLLELPARVRVESVGQVGLDSLDVTRSGMQVVGNGIVEVQLENGYRIAEETNGKLKSHRLQFAFPLNFDVELDHNLRLARVHEITANTSSFYR